MLYDLYVSTWILSRYLQLPPKVQRNAFSGVKVKLIGVSSIGGNMSVNAFALFVSLAADW